MRTGRLWFVASLGLTLLLGSYGLRAQESILLPRGRAPLELPAPDGGPGGSQAPKEKGAKEHDAKHEEHEEEAEEGEEEHVGGLIVDFDFLLLRPYRRPHDFAISDPIADRTIGGSLQNFGWETVGAYRIGLGWKLNHDWEVKAVYTYMHSNDHVATAQPIGGELFATLSAPLTFDSANAAHGSSNIDMDLVDGEFAKRWVACPNLWVRVSGGFRIASIEQKENVFYDFTDAGLGGSNVSNRIQFDGIGPRVGAEGFWRFWECLGLYAKAYTSLMTGHFETDTTQWVNDGRTLVVDVHDRFMKVVPNFELGVGMGWQSKNLSLKVGYEVQQFFGLVDTVDFPDQATFKNSYRTGDVSFEALTLSLGITY